MTQDRLLISAIREFTGAILNPFDLDELLHRLSRHATETLDATGAGIMLADDHGELAFIAATDERVRQAEIHQERLGSGACHEAFTINDVVTVPDLGKDPRWPEYSRRVRDLGLHSVIGVPLNAYGQTIGVMNVYRDRPSLWADADRSTAEILASMGAGYIVNAAQMRAQHDLSDQLRAAIESRDMIGQAKGILMARAGVDGDRAFQILRQRSQAANRKLRDVAQDLVKENQHQRV